MKPVIALVTAREARGLDEDLPPLEKALRALGAEVRTEDWDDAGTDWAAFDLALLRSTWDYTDRLPEFLTWIERVAASTRLLNPAPVVRWNTDKHYLADLAQAGVATVPSQFVEVGESSSVALERFLARQAEAELVVKPSVSAGSRDTQRHERVSSAAIIGHIDRLLAAGRSVLLQPYLDRVDQDGETALIYFRGQFSHAIRKGPLLVSGAAATSGLFAPETIVTRTPGADELQLADRVLSRVPHEMPLYARVDLIRDAAGAPCVLELELTEPSLFFATAPGSVQLFAAAVLHSASAARRTA